MEEFTIYINGIAYTKAINAEHAIELTILNKGRVGDRLRKHKR